MLYYEFKHGAIYAVCMAKRMVFHNNKKIQILKNKVANKYIRFYYIMSAVKPATTVPSEQTRGYSWTGLKLPAKIQLLKQDMDKEEEHAGGEYDINILKYFKLVSSSIDQSIFEDWDLPVVTLSSAVA